ncbi:calcium-binding protein [Ralstonia pseudosolanacearum]
MTTSLADYIGKNFTVVTQIETNPILGSSFDATVWKNNESGKLYVSMRGTQQAEDFIVDGDLALTGNAREQLVDMVNWWFRETTPAGQAARQVLWSDLTQRYEEATSSTGTGDISAADLVGGIEVNGHSLGGYLASAFTRLFGTQAHVQHTTTFNSAGFAPGSESAFLQLQNLVGVGYGMGRFPSQAEQTNYFAKNGINLTTNSLWFNQVGQRVPIFNEESANQISNHFMYKLSDALSLADVLANIDSSIDFKKFNEILEAGANKTYSSLESVLDGFRRIFFGKYINPTPVGDVSGNDKSREKYQENIFELGAAIKAWGGALEIVSLSSKSANAIAADAKADFGSLFALQFELPFAVRGAGIGNLWQKNHQDLYAYWQADQALSAADRAVGKANFSDQWLSDRAKMLSWVMYRNRYDNPTDETILTSTTADQWHFDDRNTRTSIDIGPTSGFLQPTLHAIIFGADSASDTLKGADGGSHLFAGVNSAETLQAGSGNDYLEGGRGYSRDTLIGGAGQDTLMAGNGDTALLIGGSGDDTLVGGTGVTTFQFASGDGQDVVINASGLDKLVIDGITLTGGKAIAAGNKIWQSNENSAITFTLISLGNGQQDLQIAYGNHDSILVKNYTSGAFGITLQDYASSTSPTSSASTNQPDNVINGDLTPINFGKDDNPQYHRDALGNLITDPTSSAPGRDDTLYGSAGKDLINAGSGNNQVWGGEGADTIIAGDGGNLIHEGDGNNRVTVGNGANQIFLGNGANTVAMGTGSDYVNVGGGNNQIEGNGGRDVIVAGNGDNAIFANKKIDLASAIANRDSLGASGRQGDLIAVGSGNNTIVSGTGNDLVVLGGGNDVVVLGPGNDTVVGGEVASQVYPAWSAPSVMTDAATGGQPSAGHFVDAVTHYQGLTTTSSGGYVPSADLSALLAKYPGTQQYNVDPYGNPDGGGSETIFGGSGNDLIITSNGNNYVDAGSGNSLVYAGAGDDTIFAGTGKSTITGGGGNDYINGESGNHLMAGGAGNNTIFGGSGNDTIYAGVAYGSSTGDINAGNNYVDAGSGNSIVFGSAGNDTLIAGSGQDTLVAGNGNTTIYGGTGVDLIYGGSGNDLIYAGDGGTAGAATTVVAGSGNTTIHGGLGVDVIYGGAGSDVIYVGDGGSAAQRSVVYAGSGNTTVYGGLGADEIHGGSGNDVLYAGDGGSTDAPTVVYAGTGNSTLYGGSGVDILNASAAGSTLLVGGSGNETLLGGAGDDTLVAGTGSDSMDGGAGSNTYVFNSGFGSSEIVQSGGTDILQFGAGISPSDLSISATLGANGAPALEISVGGGSVIVDGAFSGKVSAVTFADGSRMSLAQVMTQAKIVPSTITRTADTSVAFDASGNIRVTKYADDGTALSDSWQSVDGSHGIDTFQSNGSSRGQSWYANSRTGVSFGDGTGNNTTYIYNAFGNLVADNWTKSDGSSGTDTINGDSSRAGKVTNADGSTSTYTTDSQGNQTTKRYSSAGVLTDDVWTHADGRSGSDVFDANGNVIQATAVAADGSKSIQKNDGQGNTSTTQFDASGKKTGDTWQAADGSHGSDQLINGAWTSLQYASDGSYTRSTKDTLGDTTAQQFNASGVMTGSSWSNADGTHGSTTIAADGSSTSTSYNRDGSHTQTATSATGRTVTDYYSSTGQLLHDAWRNADGTSGQDNFTGVASDVTANFQRAGVYALASSTPDGTIEIDTYNSQHSKVFSIRNGTFSVPSDGGGYGGGYGGSYGSLVPISDLTQATYGKGGSLEYQEVTFGQSGGSVRNAVTLADGSSPESLWDAGSLNGRSIVSSTTRYDMQGTGVVTGTPASSLTYDVITPWRDGLKIQGSNGRVYYYDGAGGVRNLDDGPGAGTVVIVSGGVAAAINYANGNETTDVTYSDGGYSHYTTYHGWIISEEWSDGHGSHGTLKTTYPAGQPPVGPQSVITQTTTNAAGYTSVMADSGGDYTMTRYYPDGTVAEVSRSKPSVGGWWPDMLRDPAGNVLSSTYTDPTSAGAMPTVQTVSTDAAGDTITTRYTYRAVDHGYAPSTATSTWTTQDGTHVSATFDLSSGAGTETINYTDGTYSVVANDASGGYFARNYDASGTLVSDVWQDRQGSNGIDTIRASGIIDSTATYHLAQGVTETASTTTQADGSYVRTWTKTDGSTGTDTHHADGTGFGTVQYANGAYSTYTSTAQGGVTTLDYDASGNQVGYAVAAKDSAGSWLQTTYDLKGVRLSDRWTHADGTTGTDVFNADGSVETKTSLTNASGVTTTTDTITQPDGSFQRTWSKSDGPSGTDIRNADGSMSGVSDSPTGGHGTYTDDGHGNVSHTVTATADSQRLVGASVGVNILRADAAYGDVILQGGPGSDTFVLNAVAGSRDVAQLGDGRNVVYGQDGNDEVDLGAGDNIVNLGNGSNRIGWTRSANAGNGNNAIYLGDGQNTVWLGDGDNVLGVGTGLDQIHVGNGNNTLYAGHGSSNDTIQGGDGDNTVTVGDGANTVSVGNGKNKIWGGNGNNQVDVRDGNDTIGLGSGNNIVTTGNGASSVSVGDGMNQIGLGDGANTVNAGAGANIIRGGNGDNAVYVGNGGNHVEFGGGNNTVGLGTGNNTVVLGGGSNTVYAGHGTGSNTISAGDGANTVTVADGTNYINAGNGADHVYGGNGDNTISLGNGVDTVNLGDGANTIRIWDGDSAVYVGNGNNQIRLGLGNDVVSAGNGNNTLTTGDGNSNIWMGAGNNQIQVGNGNNTIGIGGVAGSTNTIQAGDGNNTIAVAAGTNDIRVGKGTDRLQTGNGVNTIHLGSGQATLTNYGGQDTVTFASSVQDDQLWFTQDGNDLLVTVDGTSSNLRLTDWFNGATHATLVAGDGHQLVDSQVASLVQAMSQFSPPAVGQTTLSQAQQDSLMPVIAASWR